MATKDAMKRPKLIELLSLKMSRRVANLFLDAKSFLMENTKVSRNLIP
jgi:hypothetical protein